MSSNLSDLYRHAILAKLGLDKSASNAVIAEACQDNGVSDLDNIYTFCPFIYNKKI